MILLPQDSATIPSVEAFLTNHSLPEGLHPLHLKVCSSSLDNHGLESLSHCVPSAQHWSIYKEVLGGHWVHGWLRRRVEGGEGMEGYVNNRGMESQWVDG